MPETFKLQALRDRKWTIAGEIDDEEKARRAFEKVTLAAPWRRVLVDRWRLVDPAGAVVAVSRKVPFPPPEPDRVFRRQDSTFDTREGNFES